jgi:hypothetical protein
MNGSARFRRRVLRWMAAGTIAMVGLAVAAEPAEASGGIGSTQFGCSQYHHVLDWRGIPIYTGTFCAFIGQNPGGPLREPLTSSGAMRYRGWFNAFSYRISGTPTACNFWVDLDLYDGGRRYFHSQGNEVRGCSSGLGSTYNRKFNADTILRPSSQVCATVWKWSGTVVVRHAGVCAVIS